VNTPTHPAHRADFETIAEGIRPGAKVLDLGCGDGSLLKYLQEARGARGYGVEIANEAIAACVKNGVNAIQSDLESGLSTFASNSFDYVILSQTLQAMRHTEGIVREMLRVGREAIVSFPNFGHWSHRLQVLAGRMPVSRDLPYQWYDTPNIHLCTLKDFEDFCARQNVRVLERIVMHRGARVSFLPNLLGSLAVFRLERQA
jgi:methionine biosynthesis protein MetW